MYWESEGGDGIFLLVAMTRIEEESHVGLG